MTVFPTFLYFPIFLTIILNIILEVVNPSYPLVSLNLHFTHLIELSLTLPPIQKLFSGHLLSLLHYYYYHLKWRASFFDLPSSRGILCWKSWGLKVGRCPLSLLLGRYDAVLGSRHTNQMTQSMEYALK